MKAEIRTRDSRRGWTVLAAVALLALLAGAGVWFLTAALSKSDIGGPGWTLRGNGSLVVPVVAGPLLLAGGWAGLALWARGGRHWFSGAALASSVSLPLGLLAAFLPVFGPNSTAILAAVALAAPAASLGIAARFGRTTRRAVLAAGVSLVLLLATAALARTLSSFVPLILPLLVVLPLWLSRPMAGAERRWRARWMLPVASFALPVALVTGFYLAATAIPAVANGRMLAPGASRSGGQVAAEVYGPRTARWNCGGGGSGLSFALVACVLPIDGVV